MTRIVRDRGSDLVIEDKPWALGTVLAVTILGAVAMLFQAWEEASPGLAFAALLLGGCAGLWFHRGIRHVRLSLPATGPATLWVRSAVATVTREIPRDRLRAAVQNNRTDGAVTVRLMLLVDGPDGIERIPFTEYYTGIVQMQPIVDRITAWKNGG